MKQSDEGTRTQGQPVNGPNVIISSAGRRVGLVRAFQEAVRPYGGKVIATDHRPELSAACQVADSCVKVPSISSSGYVDATLSLAEESGAGLIVPTLDTELLTFAGAYDLAASKGIHLSVPSLEFVQKCRDKRRTAELFDSLGIRPIREVTDEFPRFIKPISGSLSGDTHIVESQLEMPSRLRNLDEFVHQQLIDRSLYAEYTVDALYGLDGALVCAVPRRRIEVRGGEIAKGRTEKGFVLDSVRSSLSMLDGVRGCLCIQFFHSASAREQPLIGIEVNARFGGGYPMSHAAGATFTTWLVKEVMLGQSSEYREDWESDVTFLRFDDQVAVRG